MNRLSLQNNRLEFKNVRKITYHLDKFRQHASKSINKQIERCQHVTSTLDLETLRTRPVRPKNLPVSGEDFGHNQLVKILVLFPSPTGYML